MRATPQVVRKSHGLAIASASVPGHITGFFEIVEKSDFYRTGSRGCGVVIDRGVRTDVELKPGKSIITYIDGKVCECPVTKTAVVQVLSALEEEYEVKVFHRLEVPMMYGFGASASGSLGAVLALNKALELGMSLIQCGDIAHYAEVSNRTGLGDVIAECTGGFVLREEPGAPSVGKARRLEASGYVVAFLLSKLETKSILTNAEKKKSISEAGRRCMEEFLKDTSVENFLRLSRKFAVEAKLMSEEVYSAVRKLESCGIPASMIMLGNSVFTLTDEPERIKKILDFPCVTAGIGSIR